MSASFILTLDTTGPQGVVVTINDGATTTAAPDVLVDVTTTDFDTTGYQVKIWGDVDPAGRPEIQPLEANSAWITLTADIAVLLTAGDSAKTLQARLRDDVWNASNPATATIALDQGGPVLTVTGPDVDRISKVDGKRLASFTFSANIDIAAYEVRVVPTVDSAHTAGTLIGATNGSYTDAPDPPSATWQQLLVTNADGTEIGRSFANGSAPPFPMNPANPYHEITQAEFDQWLVDHPGYEVNYAFSGSPTNAARLWASSVPGTVSAAGYERTGTEGEWDTLLEEVVPLVVGIGDSGDAMSGGFVAAATVVVAVIDGRDLELASAGDGEKVIKVFARDSQGSWSI